MGYSCEISVRDKDARDAYVSACEKLGIAKPDFYGDEDKVVWDGISEHADFFDAVTEFAKLDTEHKYGNRKFVLNSSVLNGIIDAYDCLSSISHVKDIIEQIDIFGHDNDRVWDEWHDFLDGVTERQVTSKNKNVPVSVTISSGMLKFGVRKNETTDEDGDNQFKKPLQNDDYTISGSLCDNATLRVGYDEMYDTKTTIVQNPYVRRDNRHAIRNAMSNIEHDGMHQLMLETMHKNMPLAISVIRSFGEIERVCEKADIHELVLTSGW